MPRTKSARSPKDLLVEINSRAIAVELQRGATRLSASRGRTHPCNLQCALRSAIGDPTMRSGLIEEVAEGVRKLAKGLARRANDGHRAEQRGQAHR